MTVENIDVVKAGYGTILVKPLKENNYVKVGDSKVYIDTTFQKEKHAVTCGEVVSVCDVLPEELRTDIEVKVGDIVYFHYLCTLNAVRDNKYLVCKGTPYYSVPYESLYVAKRESQVILGKNTQIVCLNGFVLVKPQMKYASNKIGKVLLPDSMMKEEKISRGEVAFIGTPLKGDKALVKRGDSIIFRKSSSVPLQYGLHASFDGDSKYYRMKNESILAVDDNKKPQAEAQGLMI